MPWNEPGGKDPWGKRPKDQGPPDLEELLRKLTARLSGMFGGGSSVDGSPGGGGRGAAVGILIIAALLVVAWLFSGFYIIDAGERGLVLRFGRYVHTTTPGPHWHLPYPVETVESVNVDLVRNAEHRATMLTQDENILAIDIAAQYRVKDAANYAFEVQAPDATVRQVMESAVRDVVGSSTMGFVLGAGRQNVATRTGELMQQALDQYRSGIDVVTVNLQQAQPPEPVQPAFDDAVMAREDEVRFRNQAQSYANGIIPRARGGAARIQQEAAAYRDQVVAAARGDASRFEQLLTEYRGAPQVTRDRLYLDAMESVLSSSTKVLMDVHGGNNLFYLPLDKLMRQSTAVSSQSGMPDFAAPAVGGRLGIQSDLREPRSLSGREAR